MVEKNNAVEIKETTYLLLGLISPLLTCKSSEFFH